jgi:hypothetical protein
VNVTKRLTKFWTLALACGTLGLGQAQAAQQPGAADVAEKAPAAAQLRAADLASAGVPGAAQRGAVVAKRVFPQRLDGAVILYDNGPMITHPGGGGGGADASRLQNSSLLMNTLGMTASDAGAFRLADNFIISDVAGWDVDTVTVYCYQTGSTTTSTFDTARLQIWDGSPASGGTVVFGDMTTNRMLSTAWTNIYRDTETTVGNTTRPIMEVVIDVAGTHLDPGNYWIDFQTGGTSASGPFCVPITLPGEVTTGDALQFNGTDWVPVVDVGAQGVPFVVEGTGTPGAGIALTKTISTELGVCGASNTVSATVGTQVDYCFTVQNLGAETYNFHTLEDDHLGTILDGEEFALFPGGSLQILVTDTVSATVTNNATWTASVDSPGGSYCSTDGPISFTTSAGPGSVYPSVVDATGAPATFDSLTVDLFGITHTWPDDIDMLLVAPTGETYVMWSDVGGSNDITGLDFTLDDAAASLLPDSAVLTAGTYLPTNVGATDTFPTGAPAGPYALAAPAGAATFTSVYGAVDPSGTWQLFARDQFAGDAGQIANWCLNVTASVPTESAGASATLTALIPDASATPTAMTSTLQPGGSEAQVLTISNGGDGDLFWDMTEAPAFGGGVLFLDQAPDQVNGIFSDVACSACTTTGTQVVADNFALATTETLEVITIWSGYFPGNTPTTTDPLTVIIHNDAAGAPGAVVYQESNVASTRATTGIILFGVEEYRHTLTLAAPVSLPPGTYWIEIYNDSAIGGSPDDFFWETGAPDTVGNGIPGTVFSTTAPGTAWAASTATDFAVQLGSTPSACNAPEDLPWLGLTQTSGTLAPLASTDVAVTFFSAGLPVGTYEGVLCLESNDPDTPILEVPVTMTIDTMPFLADFEEGDLSEWSASAP